MKHPRCPDEAFTEWKKYWVSAVAKEESEQMTEMRKGKQKSPRVDRTAHHTEEPNYRGNAIPQVSYRLPIS